MTEFLFRRRQLCARKEKNPVEWQFHLCFLVLLYDIQYVRLFSRESSSAVAWYDNVPWNLTGHSDTASQANFLTAQYTAALPERLQDCSSFMSPRSRLDWYHFQENFVSRFSLTWIINNCLFLISAARLLPLIPATYFYQEPAGTSYQSKLSLLLKDVSI